jgi:tetratricopeptide (TPR) repeat protein
MQVIPAQKGWRRRRITREATALIALGRFDDADAAYQEAIRCNEKLENQRGVAISKGQLGTVRLLQERYDEALEIYTEVRDIFASLEETKSVGILWHQIGMAHRSIGQYEQAERAYRQSLVINVQQKNRAGEASSLGELGNLYYVMGRLDEAVQCYRQAAVIRVELQAQRSEGLVRSNLANTLIKLQRYDEARQELLRSIECNKPYGHVAQPWLTWSILYDLEHAIGDVEAAAQAWQQAIESYLDYRRAGGEGMTRGAHLCGMVVQALKQGETTEVDQHLTQLMEDDVPLSIEVLISRLQDILRGERNLALAVDPNLHYQDAAELQLLLGVLVSP